MSLCGNGLNSFKYHTNNEMNTERIMLGKQITRTVYCRLDLMTSACYTRVQNNLALLYEKGDLRSQ